LIIPLVLLITLMSNLDIAARTIYGEARGESPEGRAAVAWVLMNRLNKGRWGNNLSDVALARKQFSTWNEGDPNREKIVNLSTSDEGYNDSYNIMADVAEGRIPDITKGATHYHAKGKKPYWAVGQKPSAIIGNHVFYNNIR